MFEQTIPDRVEDRFPSQAEDMLHENQKAAIFQFRWRYLYNPKHRNYGRRLLF